MTTDLRTGPGRPRSADVDRAIITAALDLLVEEGYAALTMEAVAARAGVGKTTVYRRWANKLELVSDALATVNEELPALPPDGPLRERLVRVLENIRTRSPETLSGRIMPRMVAYARSHPELYRTYQERVIEPRRDRLRGLVVDAMSAGELRADLDADVAVTALVAPIIYTSFVLCSGESAPAGISEAVVDLFLSGARPHD